MSQRVKGKLSILFAAAMALSLAGCFESDKHDATGIEPPPADTGGSPPQGPPPGGATNRTPTISGSPPQSVLAGQAYSFQPSASDPDGDTLTFSVRNRPSWATFDATTGRLSGTPGAGDVGSYSSIAISVSDGQTSASLRGFSIAVNQVENGSVTLSWAPPTTNVDGSALTNLSGYRIYYGTSRDNLSEVVTLNNPGLTRYVITGLSLTTYYLAMTSLNSQNLESERSATVALAAS